MNKTAILTKGEILTSFAGITFNPIPAFTKLIKKYGDVLHLKFGNDDILVVNDPELIKYILKTNSDNFPRGKSVNDLAELLGKGLFNSEPEIWQNERRILTPAFHNSQLESFYKILNQEMSVFNGFLDNCAEAKKEFDLEYELKKLLLKVTVRNLISPDFAFEWDYLLFSLMTILKETTNKKHNFRIIQSLLTGKQKTVFSQQKQKKALEIISKTAENIVTKATAGEITAGGMLRLLLDAIKAGESTAEIATDEVKNILFAGYDTVAEGILWLLYFVSINKKIEAELQLELKQITPDNPTINDFNNSTLLQAVMKETLRIMPPVWAFYRSSVNDDEHNGYKIPAKAFIMISPLLVHRSEKYWKAPLKFDPARFLDKAENELFTYLPFGQGKHICIGNRLGQIEIMMISGLLLSQYEFEFLSPGGEIPEVKPEVIISSNEKVRVKVTRRNK